MWKRERKKSYAFRDSVFENCYSSANSVDFMFDQYIYVRVYCNRPYICKTEAVICWTQSPG